MSHPKNTLKRIVDHPYSIAIFGGAGAIVLAAIAIAIWHKDILPFLARIPHWVYVAITTGITLQIWAFVLILLGAASIPIAVLYWMQWKNAPADPGDQPARLFENDLERRVFEYIVSVVDRAEARGETILVFQDMLNEHVNCHRWELDLAIRSLCHHGYTIQGMPGTYDAVVLTDFGKALATKLGLVGQGTESPSETPTD